MSVKKIAHLTSAHRRDDMRIFYKMCASLAKHEYSVSLVVSDGNGNETHKGVRIIDVGASSGRLNRMVYIPQRILEKAITLNADLYHLHDPELIPIGLKLKRLGKIVIFDSHEDVPKQILGKHYLNSSFLSLISLGYTWYENYACSRFDAIIAATPFIRDKFFKINRQTIDINNFPILGELTVQDGLEVGRSTVCYIGGITAKRGVREMVQAMEYVQSDIQLDLVGEFSEPALRTEVEQYKGWNRVNELGFVGRRDVSAALGRSFVGLVTLHPLINYVDALPIKMFEYMSAGIPVIASNFPLWREIIEENDCGVCVDPLDPIAIAKAIDGLANDSVRALEMGQNGQRMVRDCFNWGVEEIKLLQLYKNILRP